MFIVLLIIVITPLKQMDRERGNKQMWKPCPILTQATTRQPQQMASSTIVIVTEIIIIIIMIIIIIIKKNKENCDTQTCH